MRRRAQESSSFLKKRTKKLLSVGAALSAFAWPQEQKFFGPFFQKRTASSVCAQAGFTLLEILVAVVVLGFIVAGLSQATRFGINAWDVQERLSDNAAQVERLDRVLRLLIEHAVPPDSSDDKMLEGQDHRLVLVTRLPDQPQTQPIRRAQVAIGVDDQHRLLLRWVPHPNAVAIIPPPAPQQIVLAEGVDHLDMSYRQSLADGGRWKTNWDDSNLPALVTMHIVLTSTHRQIPLIEAATMVDTNGSF